MGISFTDFTGGSSKANDFTISVGSSGNNVFPLDRTYDPGSYSITNISGDTTFDIYAVAADGSYCGYTNTSSLDITDKFNKLVILGLPNNDQLFFNYRGKINAPATAGSVTTAGAYVSSVSVSSLEDIDDTTTITGGNFANDVEVYFIGQSNTETAAKNIVVTSVNQLIVTRPDSFDPADSPYTIKVVNPGVPTPDGSNLFKLNNSITAGTIPAWNTGNTVFYSTSQPTSIQLSAEDVENSEITYSLMSGVLPQGLSLDSNTGVVSGSFSGLSAEGDSTSLTFRATDAGGNYIEKTISFVANDSPVWITAAGSLQSANANSAYSYQLTANSGSAGGAISYSLISGALPANMSLSENGVISGTATVAEEPTFTIRASDEGGAYTDRSFSILVVEEVFAEYVVVAGGGGGGQGAYDGDGAGGAGGYRSSVFGESSGGGNSAESSFAISPATNYLISIGGGGAINASGTASTFASVSTSGGGHGGYRGSPDVNPGNGGSGGGARAISGTPVGQGTAGEGFNGGIGFQGSNFPVTYQAGGGGGASAAGGSSGGGAGVASSITGSSIFRAGGGGADRGGSGGAGGGGNTRNPGTANTGGGGGSRSTGGSGAVLIRYSDGAPDLVVGSGLVMDNGSGGNISGNGSRRSPSFTTPGYKVYFFKSGTGNVSW